MVPVIVRRATWLATCVCVSLNAQANRCSLAREKSGQEIVLTAQGGDPMLQIVEQVRAEYGSLVSFEDAIFSNVNLIDISDPGWRSTHPGKRGVLVPKTHSFTVHFRLPDAGTRDAGSTLKTIVEQANSAQSMVHYVLERGTGERYTIYGEDAYRGSGGVAGANIQISDAPGVGAGSEGGKILEACSQQSPLPFEFGTVNPNALGPCCYIAQAPQRDLPAGS